MRSRSDSQGVSRNHGHIRVLVGNEVSDAAARHVNQRGGLAAAQLNVLLPSARLVMVNSSSVSPTARAVLVPAPL